MDGVAGVGHWRTDDGVEVDLVVERDDGGVVAFEVNVADRVPGEDSRGLASYAMRLAAPSLLGRCSTPDSGPTQSRTACTWYPSTESGQRSRSGSHATGHAGCSVQRISRRDPPRLGSSPGSTSGPRRPCHPVPPTSAGPADQHRRTCLPRSTTPRTSRRSRTHQVLCCPSSMSSESVDGAPPASPSTCGTSL